MSVSGKYYRLLDDMSIPGRWFLKGPVGPHGEMHDPRQFTVGKRVAIPGSLIIPVRQPGVAMDFTLADLGMPVVTRGLGNRIVKIANQEAQLIEVAIEGVLEKHAILNVLPVVDCLDAERSQVSYWTESDSRPDKVGQLRMVIGLSIDPTRAAGHHIFRVSGWEIALIVSEQLAEVLRLAKGVRLEPVSD